MKMTEFTVNPLVVFSDEAFLILGIVLFVFALIALVGIAGYVLRSLGLYTMAKSRGIRHPWLAWLPVGCEWIVGSIADQYQYVVHGKVKNRRKILLGLGIAVMVLPIVNLGINVAELLMQMDGAEMDYMTGMLVEMGVSLGTAVLSLITLVFWHICMYDLYNSCEPRDAVMFLILGIFIPVTMPYFIFFNRKKENGMPPRKPIPDEPVWQPQDPPEEPWDNQ